MSSEHSSLGDAQAMLRSTPTFLGAPIADFTKLTPECVVLAGVFCDHFGDGQPGSRFAPRQLRYVGTRAQDANPGAIRVDPRIVDLGDLNVFPLQPARNQQILLEQSSRIASTGARLLAIGGDYSVTPHLLGGLHRAHQGMDIAMVRVSRKIDFHQCGHELTRSSASTRISEMLGGDRANIVLIGAAAPHSCEELDHAAHARIIPMHIARDEQHARLDAEIDRLKTQCDALYLSVDADVLSPLFSDTSAVRCTAGLSPARLIDLLNTLAGLPIIGADVMGHVPNLDLAGEPSSSVVSRIVACLANLMLERR